AFCATSPAPIITDGLEVLVQEVMAAITTSPWPMLVSLPSSLARLLAVSSFLKVLIRCSAKLPEMPDSDTRSCGRIGPAMLGSTVVMSRLSVSVNTGSSDLALRHNPCALAYFSTSATRAGLRAVFLRKRTASASMGKKPQVAPYSGPLLALGARC